MQLDPSTSSGERTTDRGLPSLRLSSGCTIVHWVHQHILHTWNVPIGIICLTHFLALGQQGLGPTIGSDSRRQWSENNSQIWLSSWKEVHLGPDQAAWCIDPVLHLRGCWRCRTASYHLLHPSGLEVMSSLLLVLLVCLATLTMWLKSLVRMSPAMVGDAKIWPVISSESRHTHWLARAH